LPLVTLSRRLSLWGPVVLWAAVIFALSSVPNLGTDLGVWDTILRKCAHASEYAVLALLLYRAIGRDLPAFMIGLSYAVTDEVHQAFVRGRHASPFDVAMDAAGLALGLLLVHATRLWTPSGRPGRHPQSSP
jgi:VanZ family protein